MPDLVNAVFCLNSLFHQHFLCRSKESFLISFLFSMAKLNHFRASLTFYFLRNLVRHHCRFRSCSSGIFENVCLIEIHAVYKIHGLSKLFLRLPRKSYDYICCQCRIVEIFP